MSLVHEVRITFRLIVILWFTVGAFAQFGAPPGGPPPRAQQLPPSGRNANGSVTATQSPASAAGGPNSVNTINPSVSIDGAYRGSIAGDGPVASLTLADAIQRGIRYNLGIIGAGDSARLARAERLATVAQLLPDLYGHISETAEQIDLAALGFRLRLPGFSFPTVVGPFNYFDARASFNQSVSITAWRNLRSSQENARSADLNIQDSKEMVTLAVSGIYLQILASAAQVQTAQAQIDTARVVYQQAVDRNRSGLNARIDVNRSLVELQTQQQRLTSIQNDLEKRKLTLARLIGLPMTRSFTLADSIPYRDLPQPNPDDLIALALAVRPDIQAAVAQVRAAEQARGAAAAEYYPSLGVYADYGAIGVNPAQSHGTFTLTGSVQFPIYRFGRIRADIEQADAVLTQRKAERDDLKGRAEQDVRNAVLDWNTAAQQVRLAQSNRTLAADVLTQATDRFRAGVADTVELVQAQESVAVAEQDYIAALYAFQLAQVTLARATGQTDQIVNRLVQGK